MGSTNDSNIALSIQNKFVTTFFKRKGLNPTIWPKEPLVMEAERDVKQEIGGNDYKMVSRHLLFQKFFFPLLSQKNPKRHVFPIV